MLLGGLNVAEPPLEIFPLLQKAGGLGCARKGNEPASPGNLHCFPLNTVYVYFLRNTLLYNI